MIVGKHLPLLKQFFDSSKKTFTYLLTCPQTRQSILINPVWTSQCLLQVQLFSIQNNLSIKYSINAPVDCLPYLGSISAKFEKVYVQPDQDMTYTNYNSACAANQTHTTQQKQDLININSNNTAPAAGIYGSLKHFGHKWGKNVGLYNRTHIAKQGEKLVCGSIALQVVNNVIINKSEFGDISYSFNSWESLHKDFIFIESGLIEPTLASLHQNKLAVTEEIDSNVDTDGSGNDFLIEFQQSRHIFDGSLPHSCEVYPAYGTDPDSSRSTIGFEKETFDLLQSNQ